MLKLPHYGPIHSSSVFTKPFLVLTLISTTLQKIQILNGIQSSQGPELSSRSSESDIVNISVNSYRSMEEFLYHIDCINDELSQTELLKDHDMQTALDLMSIAHKFGATNRLGIYYGQMCIDLLDASNSVDVLDSMVKLSQWYWSLRVLEFIVKDVDVFDESLRFLSKRKVFEGCLREFVLESLRCIS